MRRRLRQTLRLWLPPVLLALFLLLTAAQAGAQPEEPIPLPLPEIQIGVEPADEPQEVVASLQILFLLTVLSLAPALLVLTTSFTRIVVVLAFLRNALGTQNMPPNQVLIGLALFLTFFVMQPTWAQIHQNALQPYLAGEITRQEALAAAEAPLREFMFRYTREKDLTLFMEAAHLPPPQGPEDVPFWVLVPAFALSELKTAFQIGFLIFVPFLVIDMVVSTTLMSMGMFMLPPMLVSLPFKILLFVVVDGWHLVVEQLLLSFQ